jgi:hypothetical protein
MHLAVTGNEPSIGLVGFGSGQLGLAEGMDLCRVNHADQELLLRQETRQIPSIGSGSFHTQVGFPGSVLVQPVAEPLMTVGIVGKSFAAILPFGGQESNIEFGFGYVDANKKGRLRHNQSPCHEDNGDRRSLPVHPYGCRLLPMAGLGYRPNMLAKVRQAIDLSARIKSLGVSQSCLPRSGDQPKGTNSRELVPRHKEFSMNRRLPILPLGILSAVLAAATPLALAATVDHRPLTPAQRVARIQSRLGRLEHREIFLRSKGKTQRLAKVEARVAKLQARVGKLQGN